MLEEILRQSGRVSEADLERARQHSAEHRIALDKALEALALVSSDELVQVVSKATGAPCLGGSRLPRFDPQLAALLPQSLAERLRAVPLERAAKLLIVATEDPRNAAAKAQIASQTHLDVQLVAALPSVVDAGLRALYAGADARLAAAPARAGGPLPPELSAVPPHVLKLITPEVALRFRAIPVALSAGKLRVALADATDQRALRAMRFATEHDIDPMAVSEAVIDAALAKYYGASRGAAAAPAAPAPPVAAAAAPRPRPTLADPGFDISAFEDLGDDLLAPELGDPLADVPAAAQPPARPAAPPPQAAPTAAPVEEIPAARLETIDANLLKLLSADTARNYTALPVELRGKTLVLAMPNPRDVKAVRALQYATGLLVSPVFADAESLKRAIVKHYPARVAKHVSMPTVSVDPDALDDVSDEVRGLLKSDVARRYKAVPIAKDGKKVTVAMVNPSDLAAIQDLEFVTGCAIIARQIDPELIEPYLEIFYAPQIDEAQAVRDKMDELLAGADDDVIDNVEVMDTDAEGMVNLSEEAAEEAPAVRIVNMLIKEAIKRAGSDIHLEPYEYTFRARVRVDGILYEVARPPMAMRESIVSRIKILAKLNISETRIPQDGRIKMRFKTAEGKVKELDFRVSSLPTIWGEKIVMRILDRDRLTLDLGILGIAEEPMQRFMRALQKPYGMILVVGPSGSGKTNTLYSAMSVMNTLETNIMTAEDPVEYNIKGINQVQVLESIGLNFAACLRSFLRQDPNIVLVGEIRDYETAEIAVKASLTGHLVLSTLHTADASATVSRLMNMGVEPFLVATAVLLISAQRLVRKICEQCIEPYQESMEELLEVGFSAEEATRLELKKGRGCPTCNGTGYKGRTGLFEILEITDPLRDIILSGGSTLDIRQRAREEGMSTLREAGLDKIRQGVTSVAEVKRETIA